MREIKFRVWYQGKMHNLGDIYEAYFIDGAYLEHSGHNGDEPVFMQYTGLKDKNGAEIYEGDIILHDRSGRISKFYYDNDSYSFQCDIYATCYDQEVGIEEEEFKVIGNIYENPELLK